MIYIVKLGLRVTTHTRLRARDHYTSSTLIGGKGGAGPSSLLHTTLEGPTGVLWRHDGWKVYVDSDMASNGSCFMMYFQKPPLEVGLTWNREIMALRTLTIVDLFYLIRREDPHEHKVHWNNNWLRPRSHMTSHYAWGSVTTLHDFGGVLGRPLDNFLWNLTNS
jgi:hypothetical protein